MSLCPCTSSLEFKSCCGPIIAGQLAGTAEALMRSRYTAFATKNLDYLDRTHAPEIRADFNRAEAQRMADETEWHGLKIHKTKNYGDTEEVEFIIHVRQGGKLVSKAAQSRFRRENGEWLYVSSKPAPHLAHLRADAKVGRNDPCSCGSGKKFKKCCGNAASVNEA